MGRGILCIIIKIPGRVRLQTARCAESIIRYGPAFICWSISLGSALALLREQLFSPEEFTLEDEPGGKSSSFKRPRQRNRTTLFPSLHLCMEFWADKEQNPTFLIKLRKRRGDTLSFSWKLCSLSCSTPRLLSYLKRKIFFSHLEKSPTRLELPSPCQGLP